MQGERSNEEKVALEEKIKELTDNLDQKTNTHTLLTLQLKRLQVMSCIYIYMIYLCKFSTLPHIIFNNVDYM